jgi:hypothetical protein
MQIRRNKTLNFTSKLLIEAKLELIGQISPDQKNALFIFVQVSSQSSRFKTVCSRCFGVFSPQCNNQFETLAGISR